MKTFRPYQPDQTLLLPPSIEEWLPAGHLARFVREVATELDLRAIEETYEDGPGQPPYHPRLMVTLLLYAYSTGDVLVAADGGEAGGRRRVPLPGGGQRAGLSHAE